MNVFKKICCRDPKSMYVDVRNFINKGEFIMTVCNKCNKEITPGGKFCQNCGATVEESPIVPTLEGQSIQGSYTIPVQAASGIQPPQGGGYTMQQNGELQTSLAKKPRTNKKMILIIGIILIVVVLFVVGALVLKSFFGKLLLEKTNYGGGEPVTEEGYYDLISMEEDDEIITSDEFEDYGFEGGYIKFYSDGTGDMYFSEIESFTWMMTKNEIIIDEDDDIIMTLEDDILTVEIYGDEYIYTYEKGKVPEYSTDKQKAGSPVTDIGFYELRGYEIEGMITTIDEPEDYCEYIKFYSDGTVDVCWYDFITVGWLLTEDGIVIEGDDDITMSLDGDTLTANIYGNISIYAYVEGEIPDYESNWEDTEGLEDSYMDDVFLQNTQWYGWIQYVNVWGDAPVEEEAIYDAWSEIGQNSDGGEFFDVYQIDIERPIISLWVDLYDTYAIPLVDEGWVLEHELTEADIPPLSLYSYEDTLSIYYSYESDDGSWGCDLSIYMRIIGNPWKEWEMLPPNYEEFKN